MRIVCPHDRIEPVSQHQLAREVAVSAVPIGKRRRPAAHGAREKHVRDEYPRHGKEDVERARFRQVALNYVSRQRTMLSPLYVDRNLRPGPQRMENRPMPVRAYFSRRALGVVTDPHYLLI